MANERFPAPAIAVGALKPVPALPRPMRRVAAPVHTLGAEPPEFLVLFDLLSLIGAFYAAHAITLSAKSLLLSTSSARLNGWLALLSASPGGDLRPLPELMWVLLVVAIVTVLCMHAAGGYRPLVRQSRTRLVLIAVLAPLLSTSIVTLMLFASHVFNYSRLFQALFVLIAIVALAGYRLLLRSYRVRRVASGFYARNVILIGPPRTLDWISQHIVENTSRQEYALAGYLSISPSQLPIPYTADSETLVLPCLGDVTQLAALAVHRPIQEVIAITGEATSWLRRVVEECDYFRLSLRIVPEPLVSSQLRDLQLIYHSDPLRLPEIVLHPRHVDSTALFVKRLIDIAVSASLLLLLSPLFALIAIAIKLTTPRLAIFYRWNVVGYNGRPFTGYKFTTMVEDADERRKELLAHNEMQGPVFKIRQDPRTTPLGRVLRKFSLNELPQFWSVLKGDMSLVGPRPAFPHELERYELWQKRKLSVRPGITCLWQIRGRNRIDRFDEWVQMDFEYIDNWSLWLDIKILARTAWTVVRGTGW